MRNQILYHSPPQIEAIEAPSLAPARNWSEECEAERRLEVAPFQRVVEFEREEEDVYKPQPEIPGLVLPGIERRRSSKKKRSAAQIADITEKVLLKYLIAKSKVKVAPQPSKDCKFIAAGVKAQGRGEAGVRGRRLVRHILPAIEEVHSEKGEATTDSGDEAREG